MPPEWLLDMAAQAAADRMLDPLEQARRTASQRYELPFSPPTNYIKELDVTGTATGRMFRRADDNSGWPEMSHPEKIQYGLNQIGTRAERFPVIPPLIDPLKPIDTFGKRCIHGATFSGSCFMCGRD